MNKEVRDILRLAKKQGWSYQRGGKHHILTSPDGSSKVTVPISPSDWRALANLHQYLKKAGFRR